MRIGVDLDGVCHSFHKGLIEYLNIIEHNYKVSDRCNSWHFYRDWGMTDEQFIEACNNGVDAGYVFRGNVHDGTKEAIQAIKAAGHTIHIITDRQFGSTPKASQDATIEWLAEHEIVYDTINFSADKTIVPTDMMVEDKIENYDQLSKAGTMVYLINRPWNMPAGDGRIRINNISEFAECVLAFDKIKTIKI